MPVPHDILRISGMGAVQRYLVREVESVYRSQRVNCGDKHLGVPGKVKVKATSKTSQLLVMTMAMRYESGSSARSMPS
jgi:DNA-directed RNA polymerase subunit beta'